MKFNTTISGNLHAPEWAERAKDADIEALELDQWTAQKSRFVVPGEDGGQYAVALERRTQLLDGDILDYDAERRRIVAIRIRLNDVLVADLSELAREQPEEIIHIALELGHAIGNQHWPAVVKGTKVYVPLTVDKKVMDSVMRTHRIEHVDYSFQAGSEVIPYLAPHEIRRLFGGASHENRTERDHHHHRHHAHV
ncbi:MAG: urease accessory protein UreE [Alistipes sp.]|nr:urease accessory protein UreE [Alistipes sp.]